MNYIGDIMKIKKDAFLLIFSIAVAGLLMIFSYKAKDGALYGFALAEKVIIPSLLPLLIIFNFILNSGAGRVLEKLLSPITYGVFRLPVCTGAAIFFGLLGGYPTGALLTRSLYLNDDIDSKTAARIMRFNFCGGAGFIVTAVGTGFLQDRKCGLILFASCVLSSLIIAMITAFFDKSQEKGTVDYISCSPSDALCKSVDQSAKSVISISCYIILFCAVQYCIDFPETLMPIIEITSGIAGACKNLSLPQTAFLLSFGGLCIHLQLFTVISEIKMKYFDFFIWRVAGGGLSYIFCIILLRVFPIEQAVFSNYSDSIVRLTSVNATLSVLMALACAVFVFDLENRKRKC